QSDDKNTGGSGGGGSGGSAGSGTRSEGQRNRGQKGGDGGYGGTVGANGSRGSIFKSPGATLNYSGATSSATSHPAIEYAITFDDDWRLTTNLTAKYSFELPAAPVPSRYGYYFGGWFAGEGGTGRQYYDASGRCALANDIWLETEDRTLYPRWTRNEDEPLENVSLTINGTGFTEGVDASGDGWRYVSADGRVYIDGAGGVYDISGKDVDGFAVIDVSAACSVKVSTSLSMSPGRRRGHAPFYVRPTSSPVEFKVEDGAECSLSGSAGKTTIYTCEGAELTIDAKGVLNLAGGEGASDLGLDEGQTQGGKIYIVTDTHWFSNIRPERGDEEDNGLLNDEGLGVEFYSAQDRLTRLWCVRISNLNSNGNTQPREFHIQRTASDDYDIIRPDGNGNVWLWMPNGGYEWAERAGADVSTDNMWIAYVENVHMTADFFTPLRILIDGEDSAHLTGHGWYCKRYASKNGATKATLVITNAGPHVVTGYGNAQILAECSTTLVVSNLLLNVASWEGKSAIEIGDGATLDLTIEGTNTFSAASSCAGIAVGYGESLKVSGNGVLFVNGGTGGAGIGGSPGTGDARNGAITIEGGRITAHGGAYGAGIGSADATTQSGEISVSGGYLVLRGGKNASAIGGGFSAYANVEISGGSVFPTPGAKASAIGCGNNCRNPSAGSCVFGLAAIYADLAAVSPAPKDSSGAIVFPVAFDMEMPNCAVTNVVFDFVDQPCKDLWTDSKGELMLWMSQTSGILKAVTITAVDADGGSLTKTWGVKIYEDGTIVFSTDVLTVDGKTVIGGRSTSGTGWNYDAVSTALYVTSDDSHIVTGTATNGTIRLVVTAQDGKVTFEELLLETPESLLSPFTVSNRCTVTLVGDNTLSCRYTMPTTNDLAATGSKYTAALEVAQTGTLVVEGEGTLAAKGGYCGAGIGARGVEGEVAGALEIRGGYIYATGGSGPAGGAAGIGGGKGNSISSITVSGGYVHAKGGNAAAGIGGGNSGGTAFVNEVFRVTGGTVYAESGDGISFSDFIVSTGGSSPVTGSRAVVIDGGSVRPAHASPTNNVCAYPGPVDSAANRLVFATISGLPLGETVKISDSLWRQYDGAELLVDDGGCICLWGAFTNVVRTVGVECPGIAEGDVASLEISAASNSVHSIEGAHGGVHPDSKTIDGETCWRVEVSGLPASQRVSVTGISSKYVRGTAIVDASGSAFIYVPDGEYEFTAAGYAYHASVAGAPTKAVYRVGVSVDGVDIGAEAGDGWSYDGTAGVLTLSNAVEYVVSGESAERRVTVLAAAAGVKVRAARLTLALPGVVSFSAADGATLEFTGGTLRCMERIAVPTVISGGSLDASFAAPSAPSGQTARRVTIDGFDRYARVEFSNADSLGDYDTSGIYANASGRVYLWLPDGAYSFRVSSEDASARQMIAVVEGADVEAEEYDETGVLVDGVDAGWLKGSGWRNRNGVVTFDAAGSHVLGGTNYGAVVSFLVEPAGMSLKLDSLVMTNSHLNVPPLAFGGEAVAAYSLELSGTNVLAAAVERASAVALGAKVSLTVSGTGRLDARGGPSAPGIGLADGATPVSTSLTVESGE
ncbi:MAG: hypothetical protein IKO43_05855, partial [Kiritimatiellae bacterium]|nr:hypothetical protein [Kiritimatiellia bacterium]